MSDATLLLGNEMIYFPEFDNDEVWDMYPALESWEVD